MLYAVVTLLLLQSDAFALANETVYQTHDEFVERCKVKGCMRQCPRCSEQSCADQEPPKRGWL